MEVKATAFQQKGKTFYQTVVKLSDLDKRCKIDYWDRKSNKNGYQRRGSQARFKKARYYLMKEEGVLPQSILLNIRGRVRFKPEGPGKDLLIQQMHISF